MFWDGSFINFRDVTCDHMLNTKVGTICLLRELIPLACKNTRSTNSLETYAKATYSCEKVDEAEKLSVVASLCHYVYREII